MCYMIVYMYVYVYDVMSYVYPFSTPFICWICLLTVALNMCNYIKAYKQEFASE